MPELFVYNTNFNYIFSTYSKMIYRIAFQYVKNKADAEDILQNVYIKLIEKEPSFTSEEHMKAWLIRITINLCKDYIHSFWKHKITKLSISNEYSVEDKPDPVLEELFQLSGKYRIILYLYYYENYKISEIAALLKMNSNTVSAQLQRARNKLKFIIEEEKQNEAI